MNRRRVTGLALETLQLEKRAQQHERNAKQLRLRVNTNRDVAGMLTGFPQRLRSARILANRAQREVAESLGITTAAYGNYERGDAQPPLHRLIRLCVTLNVGADKLLGLDPGAVGEVHDGDT